MSTQEIWTRCLKGIEGKINQQSYETWLKPVTLRLLSREEVVLEVPNHFFKDWILEHYTELILSTLRSVQKHEVRGLKIVIGGEGASGGSSAVRVNHTDQAKAKAAISLNPRYTFSTFVVGLSNQFAHAAARAVAESPVSRYNPLFIYGGVGLGKTHLINAIGHVILDRGPKVKLVYLKTEDFINEVISAIRYERTLDLRNKYRTVDIFLIDDIQFIAGKERTQEEFFHTFNALYDARKQIVVTCDRFPKEIPDIEERLRSRFEWGLIADIQPPDLETRIAILLKKAELEGIPLPEEVAQYLASKIKSNVRELEGSLVRLGAFASLTGKGCAITVELAKEVLKDLLSQKEKVVTADLIQRVVAEHFNLKQADMRSKRRTRAIAHPRQIAMYLCRKLTESSLPDIGRAFGGKDHTTVIHAFKQIEGRREKDPELDERLKTLKQIITS
jgi:chromosomal replication initiator protein